jgi:hypothetical protein
MDIRGLMKTSLLSAAAGLLLLSAALPATAQIVGPCADIVKKYCSDIVPGGGRVAQCLENHMDEASIACKDWLAGMKQKADDLNRACYQEIAAFCKLDKPDQMSIVQCLQEHYVNLLQDCREKLSDFLDPLRNP